MPFLGLGRWSDVIYDLSQTFPLSMCMIGNLGIPVVDLWFLMSC